MWIQTFNNAGREGTKIWVGRMQCDQGQKQPCVVARSPCLVLSWSPTPTMFMSAAHANSDAIVKLEYNLCLHCTHSRWFNRKSCHCSRSRRDCTCRMLCSILSLIYIVLYWFYIWINTHLRTVPKSRCRPKFSPSEVILPKELKNLRVMQSLIQPRLPLSHQGWFTCIRHLLDFSAAN